MNATSLTAQIEEARKAGDWEKHADLWEQRRVAEVNAEEASLTDMQAPAEPDLLAAAKLVVEACNPLPLNAKQHIAFAYLTNAIYRADDTAQKAQTVDFWQPA